MLKAPKTNILTNGLIERTWPILDEMALSNSGERQKRWRWFRDKKKNASTVRYE